MVRATPLPQPSDLLGHSLKPLATSPFPFPHCWRELPSLRFLSAPGRAQGEPGDTTPEKTTHTQASLYRIPVALFPLS